MLCHAPRRVISDGLDVPLQGCFALHVGEVNQFAQVLRPAHVLEQTLLPQVDSMGDNVEFSPVIAVFPHGAEQFLISGVSEVVGYERHPVDTLIRLQHSAQHCLLSVLIVNQLIFARRLRGCF